VGSEKMGGCGWPKICCQQEEDCHSLSLSCLAGFLSFFCLLSPVSCCCHSQFTFCSVLCYLMDLSTHFPNMTFFPSWTRDVITKPTLWKKAYAELKICKERKCKFYTIPQQCSCPNTLAVWGKQPFFFYFSM